MTFTFKLSRRLALGKLATFSFVTAAVVVACNLERRTGPDPVHPLDHISVVPPTLILQTGQTADLAAVGISVVGDTNKLPLIWQLTGGGLTDTFTLERVHFGRYRAPIRVGDYMIIVSASAGTPSDTTFVSVQDIGVDTVIVDPGGGTLLEGTQLPLNATPLDSAGHVLSGRSISWATSNSTIATVTSGGVVSAVLAGDADITATADGKQGSAHVKVSKVPVASVSVSPSAPTLSTGGTVQLNATPRDSAGNPLNGRPITWGTSAPSVATVNGNGKVSAVAAGTATISATSGTQAGTAVVTVIEAPVASVVVTPSTATTLVTGTVQLAATPRDSGGNPLTGRVVTWATNASAVATVGSNGLVTAVSSGSATITATSETKSGSASVTITSVAVASVSVTPGSASIPAGATTQLTATPRDGAGAPLSGRVVTWGSSAPGVAVVSSTGLVTGVTPGSATISATSEGMSGSATITVTAVPVATVTVSPASAPLRVGATVQLTATPRDAGGTALPGRQVDWTSSAPTVATVNSGGLVTAVAPGSATITATSETKAGTSAITVTVVPVSTVTVTPAPASLLAGGTLQLTATPKDSAGNPLAGRVVTWSSSDTTKAKVNATGLATGMAAGAATITATSETKTGTSAVTVTVVPVASVTVAPASAAIRVAGKVQLTATPKDSTGAALTGRVVTWGTSAPGVATVSASGLVTGVSPGSATITATSETKSGTASVGVTLAPVSTVTVSPAAATVSIAATQQLTATLKDSMNNTLTGRAIAWSSNAPLVASVNSTGVVTGVVAGSATLTATSETQTGTSAITVPVLPPPPPPPPPVGLCTDVTAPGVPAPLRTFYIDAAAGNDANAGTSAATAWKTLGKANAVAQPGDLFLLSGTFSGQIVHPVSSGTASAKIVYRKKPGATAVINGGQYGVIVWLDGLSHIVVDGLELSNDAEIVVLRSGTNNVWLRNLYIHDGGSTGIHLVSASDNRIEDSRIERIGSEANNAGEGIFVQNGSHRNRIVRNTMTYAGHGNVWISFQSASEATSDDNVLESNDFSNPWASGIGMNGKTNRTIVQCNRVHHTANGTGVNYPRAGVEIEGNGNIVRFNEIFRNGAEGITIQGRTFAGFVQNATNNQVYNNTLWQNGTGGGTGYASLQFIQMDAGNVQNNIVENNIFWNDRGFSYGGLVYAVTADVYHANTPWPTGTVNGNIVRYNLISSGQAMLLKIRNAPSNESFTLALAQSTLAGWLANLQVNPLFVNETADNVTLQTLSPAIDVGRILSGIPYLGIGADLGAHELR
jgi:uncharacterized protein YjdB